MDPPKNEVQGLWDAWGQQDEPFASTMPFMMTVGNHESSPGTLTNSSGSFPQEFAAFTSRWEMPLNGRGNYHYFYDYAPFRVVTVNTEEDYSTGSAQWLWLDAALGSTDRSVTPWLFLSLHRPVLSADASEAGAHVPGGALSVALEPLLFKHKVDVIFQGHQHCYDRTASVYNGGWGAHGCGALRAHAPPQVHHALPTPPFHPRDWHGHARREQRLHLAARAHLH